MYTVQQLQAFDYLLKRITRNSNSPLHGKELKLIVELNASLWYGDFLPTDNGRLVQKFVDKDGDVEQEIFTS